MGQASLPGWPAEFSLSRIRIGQAQPLNRSQASTSRLSSAEGCYPTGIACIGKNLPKRLFTSLSLEDLPG
jgi:hypothetical protein